MWFRDAAGTTDPGPDQLRFFLDGVRSFLAFVIEEQGEFGFLWKRDHRLLALAEESLRADVVPATLQLREAVGAIDPERLRSHGLVGSAMRFKLTVLESIERRWDKTLAPGAPGRWRWLRRHTKVRAWLKQMFDAIDAILDSLLAAAGGLVGGLIKEFKDALSALATE